MIGLSRAQMEAEAGKELAKEATRFKHLFVDAKQLGREQFLGVLNTCCNIIPV